MYFKRIFNVLLFLAASALSFSQEVFKDTLTVTFPQADSLFLSGNLSLLAQKCNIDAARAQVIQAKVFKNLNVSISQNVYNPYFQTMGTKKWFDFSDKGDMSVQLQKLFLLAGKRNKQINIARTGAVKEEELYFDLIRTLKYTLHSQLYNTYYLKKTLSMYEKETAALKKLAAVYESEQDKGLVSKKEYLRIKASLFSIENEKLGYLSQLISAQTDVNTLMHTSGLYYKPTFKSPVIKSVSLSDLKIQQLIDTASVSRYDLRMARTEAELSSLYLSYQKALAVPDLTVSGGWDRNGGYYHNFNYAGLQFDLPLFDRNQGNIKTARSNLENSKYRVMSAEDQVKADVIEAYSVALETDKLGSSFDSGFLDDLDRMNDEMLRNFEKRNISLIEFLDYYDAYKTNVIQMNSLLFNRANSIENLSYAVGKDITGIK
jgi:outer membrane protein, heavy metal efflux system